MVSTGTVDVDDPLSLVSDSARIIAAWRAIESEESHPLCSDSFAGPLAGSNALSIARQGAKPFEGNNLSLDNPHRGRKYKVSNVGPRVWWFDQQASAALAGSTGGKPMDQVVVMGSGMDTRPWRCEWIPDAATWFELDLPDMVAVKARAMRALGAQISKEESTAQYPLHCACWVSLAADLAGREWVAVLENAGFVRSKPTLFILEGLLMYLYPADAHKLLQTMADVAAPGSVVIAHNVTETLVNGVADGSIPAYPPFSADLVRTWNYGFPADTDGEFSKLGWRVAERITRGQLVRRIFGVESDVELEGCIDFDVSLNGKLDSYSAFVVAVVDKVV